MKAIQHHPHTSHSSQQHLQHVSVVVTPREAGRSFSVREAPAGGAEGRSGTTEAGVEEPLENCAWLKITASIDGGLADCNASPMSLNS